jgi:protein-disulfide isomerase
VSRLRPPLSAKDHLRGNPDARVTLVEYGDFECPHCGRAHPIVNALLEALGDELLFAFRNFPLSQVHPHALRAAQAAEAAGLQGAYWEMHDLIFENQESLEDEDLIRYAAECDLDLDRFARDIESEPVAEKIRADFLSGARSGVNGTPTFFVDGERYDGSWELPAFLAYLTARIAGSSLQEPR